MPQPIFLHFTELHPAPVTSLVSMRVNLDVLQWFKSQSAGYQIRINAVLRAFCDASAF